VLIDGNPLYDNFFFLRKIKYSYTAFSQTQSISRKRASNALEIAKMAANLVFETPACATNIYARWQTNLNIRTRSMKNYKVIKTELLNFECKSSLSAMYKLSPFVWKENDVFKILIRAVNPAINPALKVARAYYGTSIDGIQFEMSDGPVLAPSTNSYDKDGCEDPTLICVNDNYLVYYTGWNQTKLVGQLLLAKGQDIESLSLAGIAIPNKQPYINPKEATVFQQKDGKWILLFEYANENRSKIGKATSDNPEGPWEIQGEFLPAVKNSWDAHHLSTGPVLIDNLNQTVMFYNGSDLNTRWRIGWVKLDLDGQIISRSKKPLITPPKGKPWETDIAFAASAVLVNREIWLYYSVADKTNYRAIISV